MIIASNAKESSKSLVLYLFKVLIHKYKCQPKPLKHIAIGTAAIITLLYFNFRKLSTPPKHLRHIPYVSYVRMMKGFLTGESLPSITKRVIDPVLASSSLGLYLRPSRRIWVVCVADPQIAKFVYNKNDLFPKLDLTMFNKGTLNGKFSVRANNLFFSVGEEWKRQRRIANPAFHRAMPINSFGRYAENLIKALDKNLSSTNNTIDMSDFIQRYTLDVIGDTGFDFKFDSLQDPNNEYVTRYEKIVNAVRQPLFYFFPRFDQEYLWMFPKRKQEHEELALFTENVKEIIKRKKETLAQQKVDIAGPKEKDILTLLIESATVDDNSNFTAADDEMLLSNMCVLFTAGHETTTASILFCMYELAIHENIQEKTRQEVLSILGDDDKNTLPNADQLSNMSYLNIVLKETVRLHPPSPISASRIATQDCTLGETFVKKGTAVAIDTLSLHRQSWIDPNRFDPDRFAPNGEAEQQAGLGMTFAPFGGGQRHCIGRNFALNEQRIVLSMLLKKYKWSLPKDSIHRNGLVTKGIFLLSATNMELNLTPRY